MKITLEQLSGIRKELEKDEIREQEYKEYYRDREIINSDSTFASQVGDGLTEVRHSQNNSEIETFYNLLSCSEYVTDVNTEQIDIGTKFSIMFDGEEEKETYTLVEELVGTGQLNGFVSTKSIFGQSVSGKQENDRFEYITPAKFKVSGTIVEIKKDLSDYPHFIKDKKIEYRICHIEKQKLATLKEQAKNNNEKAQEELYQATALTKSQISILKLELEKLSKKNNRKNDASIRSTIAVINKLLRDCPMAIPPRGDYIGIGSKFKIKFLLPEEKDLEVELINKAVTTEVNDAYVEKISALGTRLLGLRNNEEFSFFNGHTTIAGIVYDIDNGKEKYYTKQY